MSFRLYPVQEKVWLNRMFDDRSLYYCFRRKPDVTSLVDREIEQRLNDPDRPNWVVVQITGETGEFKSSAGLEFLSKLDKSFSADRVAFVYSEYERLISNSDRKQAFLLDEQVFQHGLGSVRIKNNFVNIVETLRQRQNSMVLISPREKHITDENVTFTLEPCGFDHKNKVLRLLVKKYRYIGFYYLPISWNSRLWKGYMHKKVDFVERSKSQDYQRFDYDNRALELVKTMPDDYKTKKKRVVLWVEKNAANITKEERDLLVEQVIILLEDMGEEVKSR